MSDTLKSTILNPSVVTFCLLLELNLLPFFVHVTYGTGYPEILHGIKISLPLNTFMCLVVSFEMEAESEEKNYYIHDEINNIKIVVFLNIQTLLIICYVTCIKYLRYTLYLSFIGRRNWGTPLKTTELTHIH